MRRGAAALVTVSWAAMSTGCLWDNAIHYELEPAAPSGASCAAPGAGAEQMVGVALSGGGSRAAVFAAAGLEALWQHGLLGDVTHVSSVSGGSIAASYFVANHPSCDEEADPSAREACWREFFAEFKATMRANYFWRTFWRQVYRVRWFSNSRRATSLANELDDLFLDGTTFADLGSRAEAGGRGAPALLVNAASYDEARRFVFSNLCLPEPPAGDARGAAPGSDLLSDPRLRAVSFSRPGCPQPTPGEFPLSLAVATSAAVPFMLGPVTVEAPSACEGGDPEYWHLGDGGVIDNTGVETLEELVFRERRREDSALRRVLLLAFDSGKRESAERMKRIDDMWLSYRPERIVDVSAERGKGYHELLWRRIGDDLAAEGFVLERLTLRYTDARLDRWPDSCASEARAARDRPTSEAIHERLLEISTDLEIPDCDADLMEQAAHAVVDAALDGPAGERLREAGFGATAAAD